MKLSDPIDCVFLDRDGVINQAPPAAGYVTKVSELHVLPGVPQAIRQLNDAGIKVIVITNQRGISLGLYTHQDLAAIHARLQESLGAAGAHVDAIYYCPHDRDCQVCRKPATGLFRQAFVEYPGITPPRSIMIGDSPKDMQAGRAAGVRTILITGNPDAACGGDVDAIAPSLPAAIALLAAPVKSRQAEAP
jgi:D-glycero-D-manno-heptose 1,7-bisphosphate phosphatase